MKTSKIILTVAALAVLFSSCKKSDDSPAPANSVSSTVQSGIWKVTYYNDSGNDETYHFTGYQFTFASGGSVIADKSGSSVSGTWGTGNDDSTSKMVLNFGTQVPFDELNDDWHIIENTSSKIKLEDVSGGNGGTDYLTFEKI